MLTVSTFLWSDPERKRDYTFGPEHVVILRNMVKRHLSWSHEFVCVTDSADAARKLATDGIRSVPLLKDKHVPGTCFVRLMLRHPRIGGMLGRRILNLDLDCVIVGSLDDLVDRPEESVFWRNPNYVEGGRRAPYQTSIQLLDAGSHAELWRDFDPKFTPSWVNRRFGGAEQAWVSERLRWHQPSWGVDDGVYGLAREFNGNLDHGIVDDLPLDARIVFFPGNQAPHMPEMQQRYKWIAEHYR